MLRDAFAFEMSLQTTIFAKIEKNLKFNLSFVEKSNVKLLTVENS